MLVKFLWANFYAAGAQAYLSIIAVIVIELFVWVVMSIAVAVSSKLSAFLLCMLFVPDSRSGQSSTLPRYPARPFLG